MAERSAEQSAGLQSVVVLSSPADFTTASNLETDVDVAASTGGPNLQRQDTNISGVAGWTSAPAGFPQPLTGLGVAASGKNLYVVGGEGSQGPSAQVQRGVPAASGIATLTAQPSLGVPRREVGAVTYNGFLYAAGGCASWDSTGTCQTFVPDVEVSPLRADGSVVGWRPTAALPEGRERPAMVATGGRLYAVAGTSAGGDLDTIMSAPVLATGDLGAWTLAGRLPTARSGVAAVVHDGFFYVIGGRRGANTFLGEVIVAKLQADGSLGAFRGGGATLPIPRAGAGAAVVGGTLYVAAGQNSFGALSDVWRAPLFVSGGVGGFATLSSLASARSETSLVRLAGALVVVGGDASGPATLEAATVSGARSWTGGLGSWRATTALPTPRRHAAAVVVRGALYVIGGCDAVDAADSCLNANNDVLMAPIEENGSLGPWTSLMDTRFSPGRERHGLVAIGDELVLLGGVDTTNTPLDDVLVAQVNPDQTVSGWTASPNLLSPARSHPGAVVSNGRLFVAGGYGPSGYLNDTASAPLVDGGVGPWTPGPSFAVPRREHLTFAVKDSLYVIGGWDGGDATASVQQASTADGGTSAFDAGTSLPDKLSVAGGATGDGALIVVGGWDTIATVQTTFIGEVGPAGEITRWLLSTSLPGGRQRLASAAGQGYVYAIGGESGFATLTGEVDVAEINQPAQRGRWSRQLDLQGMATLDALTVQGAAENRGTVAARLRVAGPDGVFGAPVELGTVPLGAAVPLSGLTGRYVWLELLLDDSGLSPRAPDSRRDVQQVQLAVTLPPDTSPPLAGTVLDGSGPADLQRQTSTTTLGASWSGFSDPESGIIGYAWALGTTPGGTDVQDFIDVGPSTHAANTALTLAVGTRYYATVRAWNGAGQMLEARSDGVTVELPGTVHITSQPTLSATCKVPYTYGDSGSATAIGDAPITWSAPTAPAGFQIDPHTGAVSWTPTSTDEGDVPITLRAENAITSDTQSFTVTVACEHRRDLRVACGCESGAAPPLGLGLLAWAACWARRWSRRRAAA